MRGIYREPHARVLRARVEFGVHPRPGGRAAVGGGPIRVDGIPAGAHRKQPAPLLHVVRVRVRPAFVVTHLVVFPMISGVLCGETVDVHHGQQPSAFAEPARVRSSNRRHARGHGAGIVTHVVRRGVT